MSESVPLRPVVTLLVSGYWCFIVDSTNLALAPRAGPSTECVGFGNYDDYSDPHEVIDVDALDYKGQLYVVCLRLSIRL